MALRIGIRVALVVLLAGATACYHYATQRPPLAQALATPQDRVRVTLLDSTEVTLYAAGVVGDSLVGWSAPPERGAGLGRVAIAVTSVRRVEVYRLHVIPSLAAGAAGAFVVFVLAMGAGFLLLVAAIKGAL